MPSHWLINGHLHDLSMRGWIMGVLNVTPDSFSDGGNFFSVTRAVEHGLMLVQEGADVIDVGGESTRPGAASVGLDEEMHRVIPVIERLRPQTTALISIDTMKPEVARAALHAGADIINDVSGFREAQMISTAASCDAGLIVMHMQGLPRTMQSVPHYDDVVREVRDYFAERLLTLAAGGIARERIAFDPGIGFGKTAQHNAALLRGLSQLRVEDRPLVLGVSRKSFIGHLLGDMAMESRDWPTVALTAWMREGGADVVRVHDVKPNVEALKMIEAIRANHRESSFASTLRLT